MSRHSLEQVHSAPRVKQQPAAVRMLFHGLITVQVLPTNPAAAVRGPKHGHALGNRFAGVFDRMLPHTPWKAVIEAAAAVREARADLIATVGSGSVTDGAKRCKLYPDAAVIVPPRSAVEILLRDLLGIQASTDEFSEFRANQWCAMPALLIYCRDKFLDEIKSACQRVARCRPESQQSDRKLASGGATSRGARAHP
jgi:hypothetical protein